MNKTYLIACAAALLVAPMALAHNPTFHAPYENGTPKDYCEPVGEWSVHDYGPPATGRLLEGWSDGNILGDCSGDNSDCYRKVVRRPLDVSANTVCFATALAEFDLHKEFALGGAIILSSARPFETEDCYGLWDIHNEYGPVTVVDNVLGTGATFYVGVDSVDATGGENPCGDFLVDNETKCVDTCTVTFRAGLDGAYYVHVEGTMGHVLW